METWTGTDSRPGQEPLELEIHTDVPATLQEYVRLTKFGRFREATKLYEDVLKQFQSWFPIVAEHAESLYQQGKLSMLADFTKSFTTADSKTAGFTQQEADVLRLWNILAHIAIGREDDATIQDCQILLESPVSLEDFRNSTSELRSDLQAHSLVLRIRILYASFTEELPNFKGLWDLLAIDNESPNSLFAWMREVGKSHFWLIEEFVHLARCCQWPLEMEPAFDEFLEALPASDDTKRIAQLSLTLAFQETLLSRSASWPPVFHQSMGVETCLRVRMLQTKVDITEAPRFQALSQLNKLDEYILTWPKLLVERNLKMLFGQLDSIRFKALEHDDERVQEATILRQGILLYFLAQGWAQDTGSELKTLYARMMPHMQIRSRKQPLRSHLIHLLAQEPQNLLEHIAADRLNTYPSLVTFVGEPSKRQRGIELQQAAGLMKAVFGEEHFNTLQCLIDLAYWYLDKQETEKASTVESQLLHLTAETLSQNNVGLTSNMAVFVILNWGKPSTEGAEVLQRQLLDSCIDALELELPGAMGRSQRISEAFLAEGRLSAAQRLLEKLLEIVQKKRGQDHPETFEIMSRNAQTLSRQEKYEDAELMYRRMLTTGEKIFEVADPRMLACMSNIATMLLNQAKNEEAESAYKELLAIEANVLQFDDPLVIADMCNLAEALNKQKKSEEAESMYRQVLAIQQKSVGADHPRTLMVAYRLGLHLENQDRYDESRDFYETAYSGFRALFGNDDLVTHLCYQGYQKMVAMTET